MGCIRTILALSVVFSHTLGFVFVGGQLAVQLFYIVSGFLISYVLIESRTYKSKKAFYLNRLLRLFPIYWIVTIFTLMVVFVSIYFFNKTPELINTYLALDTLGKITLIFSNIFLFGQDWILFSSFKDGTFQFFGDFKNSDFRVFYGLISPQAWTLGIELSFYLIAPFILNRIPYVVLLLVLSILLRIYFIYIGIGLEDPWTYRFFPTELSLFLLGVLSHQLWKPYIEKKKLINQRYSNIAVGIILGYCLIYFLLPYRNLQFFILIVLFLILLPWLFNFQKENKWDSKIGELSYPIYICHMLIVMVAGYLLKQVNNSHETFEGSILIITLTILFSILLNLTVGEITEKIRMTIKLKQK